MANEFSSGITFYKEEPYMFKYYGLDGGIKWCHVMDEEFFPVAPHDHNQPNFTEAYNRAMNIFTSSYKPPVEE